MVALADLHAAPWNPRSIDAERLANLVEAIKQDPDFLWRRPVLAMADGTVYAGNQRLRAAAEIGMAKIPAILADVDERLARERAIRDNEQWGEWRQSDLTALLVELRDGGGDLSTLGLTRQELEKALSAEKPPPTEFPLVNPDVMPDLTAQCPGCGFEFSPELAQKVRPS